MAKNALFCLFIAIIIVVFAVLTVELIESWPVVLSSTISFIISSVPRWVWDIIGAWIYLNLGWAIAEYVLKKLEKLEHDHRETIFNLFYFLPALLYMHFTPHLSNAYFEKEWNRNFKIIMLFLWFPAVTFGILSVIIAILLFILTWGRYRPKL